MAFATAEVLMQWFREGKTVPDNFFAMVKIFVTADFVVIEVHCIVLLFWLISEKK